MDKKLIVLTVISLILIATIGYAVSDTKTKTLLYFNINADRSIQVLTLGGTWATATVGGTPTTGNIEFNTNVANARWVNASIVSGGTQDESNPILQIRNIGTVNAQIDMSINQTLPASPCEILLGYNNDTMDGAVSNASYPTQPLSTANITLTSALTYSDAPLDLWLYANYTGCSVGDSTARNFTIYAVFAS